MQFLFKDSLCNVRRKKDAKHSVYDALSDSDVKESAQLVTDILCPGGHADVFCTARQFVMFS